MRRIVLILALTVFLATVVFVGSGMTQEVNRGCEGIITAFDAQDVGGSPKEPSQGGEHSALGGMLTHEHGCKAGFPAPPPGTSGGQGGP
jgi:hypothetical protein